MEISINVCLGRYTDTVKSYRVEEVPSFVQTIVSTFKKNHGCKIQAGNIKALISLSSSRVLRTTGKVWDQVSMGDRLWVVTNSEWDEYQNTHLQTEALIRNGKVLVIRHPSFLSYEKLSHFIAQYHSDFTPKYIRRALSPDPKLRVTSSTPKSSSSKPRNSVAASSPDMTSLKIVRKALVQHPSPKPNYQFDRTLRIGELNASLSSNPQSYNHSSPLITKANIRQPTNSTTPKVENVAENNDASSPVASFPQEINQDISTNNLDNNWPDMDESVHYTVDTSSYTLHQSHSVNGTLASTYSEDQEDVSTDQEVTDTVGDHSTVEEFGGVGNVVENEDAYYYADNVSEFPVVQEENQLEESNENDVVNSELIDKPFSVTNESSYSHPPPDSSESGLPEDSSIPDSDPEPESDFGDDDSLPPPSRSLSQELLGESNNSFSFPSSPSSSVDATDKRLEKEDNGSLHSSSSSNRNEYIPERSEQFVESNVDDELYVSGQNGTNGDDLLNSVNGSDNERVSNIAETDDEIALESLVDQVLAAAPFLNSRGNSEENGVDSIDNATKEISQSETNNFDKDEEVTVDNSGREQQVDSNENRQEEGTTADKFASDIAIVDCSDDIQQETIDIVEGADESNKESIEKAGSNPVQDVEVQVSMIDHSDAAVSTADISTALGIGEGNVKEDALRSDESEEATIEEVNSLQTPNLLDHETALNDTSTKLPGIQSNELSDAQVVSIPATSASVEIPQSSISDKLNDSKAIEMELTLQKKNQELEETKRAKQELEARLEETRYLLQLIAGGARPAPYAAERNNPSREIRELEDSLRLINVVDRDNIPPSLTSANGKSSASANSSFVPKGSSSPPTQRKQLTPSNAPSSSGNSASRYKDIHGFDRAAKSVDMDDIEMKKRTYRIFPAETFDDQEELEQGLNENAIATLDTDDSRATPSPALDRNNPPDYSKSPIVESHHELDETQSSPDTLADGGVSLSSAEHGQKAEIARSSATKSASLIKRIASMRRTNQSPGKHDSPVVQHRKRPDTYSPSNNITRKKITDSRGTTPISTSAVPLASPLRKTHPVPTRVHHKIVTKQSPSVNNKYSRTHHNRSRLDSNASDDLDDLDEGHRHHHGRRDDLDIDIDDSASDCSSLFPYDITPKVRRAYRSTENTPASMLLLSQQQEQSTQNEARRNSLEETFRETVQSPGMLDELNNISETPLPFPGGIAMGFPDDMPGSVQGDGMISIGDSAREISGDEISRNQLDNAEENMSQPPSPPKASAVLQHKQSTDSLLMGLETQRIESDDDNEENDDAIPITQLQSLEYSYSQSMLDTNSTVDKHPPMKPELHVGSLLTSPRSMDSSIAVDFSTALSRANNVGEEQNLDLQQQSPLSTSIASPQRSAPSVITSQSTSSGQNHLSLSALAHATNSSFDLINAAAEAAEETDAILQQLLPSHRPSNTHISLQSFALEAQHQEQQENLAEDNVFEEGVSDANPEQHSSPAHLVLPSLHQMSQDQSLDPASHAHPEEIPDSRSVVSPLSSNESQFQVDPQVDMEDLDALFEPHHSSTQIIEEEPGPSASKPKANEPQPLPNLSDEMPLVLTFPKSDILGHLKRYYYPFLVAHKYAMAPQLKGTRNRQELLQSISEYDLLAWIVFQIFGGSADSIIVTRIKTTQITRALAAANVGKMASSQLDLLLVKIKTQVAKEGPAAMALAGLAPTSDDSRSVAHSNATKISETRTKTGTIIKKKISASSGSAQTNSSSSDATFPLFLQVLRQLPRHSSSTSESDHLQRISQAFASMLMQHPDVLPYHRHTIEASFSSSGVLVRSIYATITPHLVSPCPLLGPAISILKKLSMPAFAIEDVDGVRMIWERNSEQLHQIYTFYASALETRRISLPGSAAMKLQLSLENTRELLIDFGLLPQLLDVQSFYRLFRATKLWEWEIAECILRSAKVYILQQQQQMPSSASPPSPHHGRNNNMLGSTSQNGHVTSLQGLLGLGSTYSLLQMLSTTSIADINRSQSVLQQQQQMLLVDLEHVPALPTLNASIADPADILGSIGHFSLSYPGFLELIARIASLNVSRLTSSSSRRHHAHSANNSSPQHQIHHSPLTETVENMLHIMDASEAKAQKLSKASRRSITVRHFVYSNTR